MKFGSTLKFFSYFKLARKYSPASWLQYKFTPWWQQKPAKTKNKIFFKYLSTSNTSDTKFFFNWLVKTGWSYSVQSYF